jgi:antitoxin component of RelBE/YafQ-DinJ toxin-antitoxin module
LTCVHVCVDIVVMGDKDEILNVRIDRKAKRVIEDAAKREGLTVSAYVRQVCVLDACFGGSKLAWEIMGEERNATQVRRLREYFGQPEGQERPSKAWDKRPPLKSAGSE